MAQFKNDMVMSITEYVQKNRDSAIKNILTLVDVSDLPHVERKRIRKAVLDEINNLYTVFCRHCSRFWESSFNVPEPRDTVKIPCPGLLGGADVPVYRASDCSRTGSGRRPGDHPPTWPSPTT